MKVAATSIGMSSGLIFRVSLDLVQDAVIKSNKQRKIKVQTLTLNCSTTPLKRDMGGAMEQFEARFKQVDVLPLVKHYMDELDLLKLLTKWTTAI